MNKLFALFIMCSITIGLRAQETVIPTYQPYGKVDKADLELKSCDFEKDANAEILFAKGTYEKNILFRHIRIKIFNTAGVNRGSIRIPFINYSSAIPIDGIEGFKAETINLDDDKINIIPVDKKQIYTEYVNKYFSVLVFAFPAVKPGSILEYEFSIPAGAQWYFQSDLPCRYSEIEASLNPFFPFKFTPHVSQPFFKSRGETNDQYQIRALINIHSLPDEPYMGGRLDNLERMDYTFVNPNFGNWESIAQRLTTYYDFGGQFNKKINGEDTIIKKVQIFKSIDEKVSYIFDCVKNNMKWNNSTNFATVDGISTAWDKKSGNSAEINLILYHLLKKSGIPAVPLVIASGTIQKINPFNPDPYSFDNAVIYVPYDVTDPKEPKFYILDATNKYNMFNIIPEANLNTFGIRADKNDDDDYTHTLFKFIFMSNSEPVLHSYYVTGEITPNGKMNGNAQLNSFGYNKIDDVTQYKTKGEEKFKDYLSDNNNDIKISSLKMDNMEVDTLPLTMAFNFTQDLPGTDNNYIYFAPNVFFSPNKNPFLTETRYTDVDFKYMSKTLYNGIFKVPAGYKVDALPKNMSMIMPDTSITFRRKISTQNDTIVVRYTVYRKKNTYFKAQYPEFYQFFKKMYEMLSEQIVLKKS